MAELSDGAVPVARATRAWEKRWSVNIASREETETSSLRVIPCVEWNCQPSRQPMNHAQDMCDDRSLGNAQTQCKGNLWIRGRRG